MFSAMKGYEKVAELLLQNGAELNATSVVSDFTDCVDCVNEADTCVMCDVYVVWCVAGVCSLGGQRSCSRLKVVMQQWQRCSCGRELNLVSLIW
jgi:hypothetical protein